MQAVDNIHDDNYRRANEKYPILKYFKYQHLSDNLQQDSRPFHDLAYTFAYAHMESKNPAEVAAGLRKLLEAKDCMVRAAL